MASGFDSLSLFDGLSPVDMADLLKVLQQAPQGAQEQRRPGMVPGTPGQLPQIGGPGLGDLLGYGGAPQPSGPPQPQPLPIRGAGDTDVSGRGVGSIDQRRPSIAMNEDQAQALERAQAGPQDLAALGPRPGSPGALLFDRDPMGSAQGFTGRADPLAPRAMPFPPSRPSDADLMMPGSAGAGAPRQADPPILDAQRYPETGRPPGTFTARPGVEPRPVDGFDPLTGQPVSGSPQPLAGRLGAAPGPMSYGGTVQAPGGAVPGAPQQSILEKFAAGLQNPDVSSLLLHMGMGLMSERGFGPGMAAGLKSYEGSRYQGLAQQLQMVKYLQEQQTQHATYEHLTKNLKMDPVSARAAMLNGTVLQNALTQASRQPQTFTANGKVYLGFPENRAGWQEIGTSGQTPDQAAAVSEAQARGTMVGGQKPLDRMQAESRVQAAGKQEGAPEKPRYVKVRDQFGNEIPYRIDDDSGDLGVPKGFTPPGPGSNPYASGGKFNENQGKAAGFSDRMMASEQNLRRFENINEDGRFGSIDARVGQALPNSWKSAQRQQFEQAQRDFLNAQLRRESGAAIAQKEFDNATLQYFPVPGDKPETVAQKRQERQRAIEAMGREAAPAYSPSHVFDEKGGIVRYGGPQQGAQSPATPSIPDAAVQHLQQNPGLRDAFDQKYGRGASTRILGGR